MKKTVTYCHTLMPRSKIKQVNVGKCNKLTHQLFNLKGGTLQIFHLFKCTVHFGYAKVSLKIYVYKTDKEL